MVINEIHLLIKSPLALQPSDILYCRARVVEQGMLGRHVPPIRTVREEVPPNCAAITAAYMHKN